MNNLKYAAFFFAFIFPSLSYCGNPCKTFEEIADHIKDFGYAAGEDNFNEVAFGINANDVNILMNRIKIEGQQANKIEDADSNKSSHGSEIACGLCAFSFNKTIEYGKLCYSDEIYDLLDRVIKKICLFIDDKFIKVDMILYHDVSDKKEQLGWHGDWWSKGKNPKYLGFAVLNSQHGSKNDDIKIEECSKLNLGHIYKNFKHKYRAEKPYKKLESVLVCSVGLTSATEVNLGCYCYGLVEMIATINNSSGSGYFINQEFEKNPDNLIVHCRRDRYYWASRLSLVLRCYCYDNEDEMKKDNRIIFPENKECKSSDSIINYDTALKTKPVAIIEKKVL